MGCRPAANEAAEAVVEMVKPKLRRNRLSKGTNTNGYTDSLVLLEAVQNSYFGKCSRCHSCDDVDNSALQTHNSALSFDLSLLSTLTNVT